jgi:tetratricopeptide (TPR) repeat protein
VKRLNIRWLVLTLVIVGLAVGGLFAWKWWTNRPNYLLQSAQDYVTKAGEEERAENPGRAKDLYLAADTQLRNLNDQLKEAPKGEDRDALTARNRQRAKVLVLRAEVLRHLADITRKQEQQGEASDPSSTSLSEASLQAMAEAANLDPNHALAQWSMLDYCLRTQSLAQAHPYAAALVSMKKEESTADTKWDTYARDQVTACWVMAHQALANRPPLAEAALDYLKKAREFDQEYQKETNPKAAAPLPRWRAVDLEAWALAAKADPQVRVGQIDRVSAKVKRSKEFQDYIEQGVERAQAEANEPVPEATKQRPERLSVAWMGLLLAPTDLPGLCDFLLLAVQGAPNGKTALTRASTAVAVASKLAAPKKDRALVYTLGEAEKLLGRLHPVIRTAELDKRTDTPSAEEWREVRSALHSAALVVLEKNPTVDPVDCLLLAENAERLVRSPKDYADVLKVAHIGLAAAEKAKDKMKEAPAKDKARFAAAVRGLNAIAANYYLVQNQEQKAAPHLKALRGDPDPKMAAEAYFLQGRMAFLQGKLEQAREYLNRAVKVAPMLKDRPVVRVYQAYAALGLGRADEAAVHLVRLRKDLAKIDQEPAVVQDQLRQLVPNEQALTLHLLRCALALDKEKEALELKGQLKYREAQAAAVLLANYYLSKVQNTELSATDKAEYYGKAREEIAAARAKGKGDPGDPGLAWADAVVRLYDPDKKPEVNTKSAEDLLKNYVAANRSSADAQLVWVRWLRSRGKNREALKELDALEKKFPKNRSLELTRAQLLLASGQPEETLSLLKTLSGNKPNLMVDLLEAVSGDGATGAAKLKAALAKNENSGAAQYYNGVLLQYKKEWREAIKHYERSLQFARLAPASERGLLTCLLAIRVEEAQGKAKKGEANKLAYELLRNNREVPALLLAFAETAVPLDNIYGTLNLSRENYSDGPDSEHSMEGALNHLAKVYLERKGQEVLGVYYLARGWLAAARPDRARRYAEAAVRVDPNHVPSRVMAVQLAQLDLDYATALKHLDELERLKWNADDLDRARAVIYTNLDQRDKAKEIYQRWVTKYPDQFAGYAGLAQLRELVKDYPGALAELRRWKAKVGKKKLLRHDTSFQMEVGYLVRTGKADEAKKLADAYLAKHQENFANTLKEEIEKAKQPRKKNLTDNQADLLANNEINLLLLAADAFTGAEAYATAEEWAERALSKAATFQNKKARTSALENAQVTLGNLYLSRSRASKGAEKDTYAKKAVDLYRQLWKNNPRNLVVCNNLAWLLNEQKAKRDEILRVAANLRKGPTSGKPIGGERLGPNILDTLGVIYRDASMNDEAVTLFEQAVYDKDGAPGRYWKDPKILLHLGRAYARVKKGDKSNEILTRARNLASERAESPGTPKAKEDWAKLAEEARKALQNPLGA